MQRVLRALRQQRRDGRADTRVGADEVVRARMSRGQRVRDRARDRIRRYRMPLSIVADAAHAGKWRAV